MKRFLSILLLLAACALPAYHAQRQAPRQTEPRAAPRAAPHRAGDMAAPWRELDAEQRSTPARRKDGTDDRPDKGKPATGKENKRMKIYTIDDCGELAFRGDYPESGTHNGAPYFQLDAGHFMLWNGTSWAMNTGLFDEAPYYTGGTNPADPSDGAWGAFDMGAPPAPTVTLKASTPTTRAFTITTGANKYLPAPTCPSDDVTITRAQAGSDGAPAIPGRVPMLNRNFSIRRAADFPDLETTPALTKAMMMHFDLSGLVNPVWFFDESETTFTSHVDGEAPAKTLGIRLAASSPDLAALKAAARAQPSAAAAYQLRAVHADDSRHSFRAEFYAVISGAASLGAGSNVRYVEFPLTTVIHGNGAAARFIHTAPA